MTGSGVGARAAGSGSASDVLYIVDGLGLSGKTKAMVDLIGGLDPDRYRATVICFDTEGSPLAARLSSLGVHIEVIRCPDGLRPSVAARIGRVVRRLRPAVVHCYNPRTMLYGGAAARVLGVQATVGTLSAFACLTPEGQYRFLPQRLFSTSRRNRVRNKIACGLMRAVVTVSPRLGRGFCRYNWVDPARMRVVSYGVDIGRFTGVTADQVAAFRARFAVPPGAVLVGSIGRLVEQKDYPTQLRAFAQAAARAPSPLMMMLVGGGPLEGAIRALAAELGVTERVRFVGHSDEVPVALRAMDIFVLASKFEPYGVALLEAKAAGTAIVATRVNEVPEILSEDDPGGASGWLVPPEDPAAMADAFVALAGDPARRRALGERAAVQAVARHSLRALIDGYQAIYDQARGLSPMPGAGAGAATGAGASTGSTGTTETAPNSPPPPRAEGNGAESVRY